jgi:hypothetical protein
VGTAKHAMEDFQRRFQGGIKVKILDTDVENYA